MLIHTESGHSPISQNRYPPIYQMCITLGASIFMFTCYKKDQLHRQSNLNLLTVSAMIDQGAQCE